jgi:hypothetical protein
MNKRRRTLTKKVTSINFYVDQAIQIQAIMEAIGENKEAPLVRQLVDEALAARRRKSVRPAEPDQPPPTEEVHETLQTVQTLLLKLIGQGETTFRIQSVSLELLQETLAEAHDGRVSLWEFLLKSVLREKGRSDGEIARLAESQNSQSKTFAYRLAEEIKNELDSANSGSNGTGKSVEDRQESFEYDDADTQEAALSTQT